MPQGIYDDFFLILLILVIVRVLKSLIQFYSSWGWFKKKNGDLLQVPVDLKNNFRLIILIPVLREQNIIHQTVKLFGSLKYVEKVIFITTERENYERGGWRETTFDILQREKEKYNNIEIIHYPRTTGVMAHQLNYACDALRERDYDGFISVYNADSVIGQDSINALLSYTQCNHDARIIQQSAVFIDNYQKFPKTFRGDILKAVALYQSRWTFTHELYRLRNQFENKNKWLEECGHVVGHGLCIDFKTLTDAGYFPSTVPNEDLPLGMFLRLMGEKIHVLPILEIGESPRTLEAVIKQYTSWFYGVIYYPAYYKIAVEKFPQKRFKAFVWTIVNTGRAFIWLFTTYVWLFLFVTSLFIGWRFFVLVTLVFLLYSIGNNYLIFSKLRKLFSEHLDEKLPLQRIFGLCTASLIVYFLQSVGPTVAVKNIIISNFSRSLINKNKTERT